MKNMKVNAVVYQDVYIDPADALRGIKDALGFVEDRDSVVRVKDGKLMRGNDISHHGSPCMEYEAISNNPKWIELYNSIKCLSDYFEHSEESQWNKFVDNNEV